LFNFFLFVYSNKNKARFFFRDLHKETVRIFHKKCFMITKQNVFFLFRFLHSFQYRPSHSKTHDRIFFEKRGEMKILASILSDLSPIFSLNHSGFLDKIRYVNNSHFFSFHSKIQCYNYFFFFKNIEKRKTGGELYRLFFGFFHNQ